MSRVMRLAFRGGAVIDVPLAQGSEVTTRRDREHGGFISLEWANGPGVNLLSMEPSELAAVLVMEAPDDR